MFFLVCYFINNIIFNKLIPMDRFSFFNSASSAFFDDLYEQYLNDPDSVEPSWRSFFQGYDFQKHNYSDESLFIPEEISKKNFK